MSLITIQNFVNKNIVYEKYKLSIRATIADIIHLFLLYHAVSKKLNISVNVKLVNCQNNYFKVMCFIGEKRYSKNTETVHER